MPEIMTREEMGEVENGDKKDRIGELRNCVIFIFLNGANDQMNQGFRVRLDEF